MCMLKGIKKLLMKNERDTLFYIALALLICGITLIGWGLGRVLNYSCEGFVIGIGTGLCVSALVLLKKLRRRDAFAKK